MGIGKRCHTAKLHHQRFHLTASGCTVFQNDPGNFFFHFFNEFPGCLHIPAQTLAQGFLSIASDADCIVVVHLHITEAILFQSSDDNR